MQSFNQKLQGQFLLMQSREKLFRVGLTGDQIWELYLKSFEKEDDPIFRDPNSTVHNCNHCHNFIRRYGNIVAINNNLEIETIFDVEAGEEYKNISNVVAKAIKNATIVDVFFETFNELKSLPYESCTKSSQQFQLGVASNVKRYTKEEAEKYGVVKPNEVRTFHHIHLFLKKQFVDATGASIEAIMGGYRDAKNVFQRGMETISLDTLNLVRDLINQGSLLDGTTHLYKIEYMINLKTEWDTTLVNKRNTWCWLMSHGLPIAKFRNELIGTLCAELSEGEELNKACQAWNKRVDPANYMKASAPITKKQIEEARKFVEENGYEASFDRRLATMDDIKVSEILHSNVGSGQLKSISIFDKVKSTSTRHKRAEFEGIEEVGIDKFMKDILPTCTSVELFLTNSFDANMVTLTTSRNNDSLPIFKWNNNYSWTFNGNLAGKSQIKQAVKDAGGNVEGVLNARLAWNYGEGGTDNSDLDLWAQEPTGRLIGYNTGYRKDVGGKRTEMTGQLDVDNTNPMGKLAVENITWTSKSKMKDGMYFIFVNQFSERNSQGFKVEIEFDGDTYCYDYNKPLLHGRISVAEVTLTKRQFSIKHLIPESAVSSKEIYGLETNQFHKVNLMCLSPNHWQGNNVGNKHYFFMLEGCKCPVAIRSFHNENLLPEIAQHRKVLEVLGATNTIAPTDKQLSGVGFNATVRDEVVLKLFGTHKRMIKVKF